VFITGGGSGIGACLVRAFTRQAALVAFVDINAGVGRSRRKT
jgi:NAD(P)-dependent dehydrogenase (short-subunit alcohol dehydrogenase family)